MEMVPLPELGTATSAVGFGCAGLGGRLSDSESLRLLEKASSLGIVHFDVARSYGYGGAEAVVGRFIRNRRDEFFVVSKLGITPLPRSPSRELAVKVARSAVRLAPRLRQRFTRRAAARVEGGAFDLESAGRSLDATLDALRTDHLDLLLLHECTPADVTDELVAWLDSTVTAGKARAWGLATTPEHTREILTCRQAQAVNVASSASRPNGDVVGMPGPVLRVTHSAISADVKPVLKLVSDPWARRRWEERIGESLAPERIAAVLLLAARGRNPRGVVLGGTQRLEHLAPLAAVGSVRPDAGYAAMVGDLVAEATRAFSG